MRKRLTSLPALVSIGTVFGKTLNFSGIMPMKTSGGRAPTEARRGREEYDQ
jgi:hypothetical protein